MDLEEQWSLDRVRKGKALGLNHSSPHFLIPLSYWEKTQAQQSAQIDLSEMAAISVILKGQHWKTCLCWGSALLYLGTNVCGWTQAKEGPSIFSTWNQGCGEFSKVWFQDCMLDGRRWNLEVGSRNAESWLPQIWFLRLKLVGLLYFCFGQLEDGKLIENIFLLFKSLKIHVSQARWELPDFHLKWHMAYIMPFLLYHKKFLDVPSAPTSQVWKLHNRENVCECMYVYAGAGGFSIISLPVDGRMNHTGKTIPWAQLSHKWPMWSKSLPKLRLKDWGWSFWPAILWETMTCTPDLHL